MKKIAVLGCGAWGTTVAKILADNLHEVRLWCHSEEVAQAISRTHELSLLPGVRLPKTLKPTANLEEAMADVDAVVLGVASPYIDILERAKPFLKGQPVLSIGKGLLENRDQIFISDYCRSVLGSEYPFAILSGPNLAIEIAQELPAASVVASDMADVAQFFQTALSNHYFRIYTSTDVTGVEIGGVFKNAIAIAAGCVAGLGFGQNTLSLLLSRSLQEMSRFGRHFGAQSITFTGLSGLGDMITTCTSDKSRNFRVGLAIAKHHDLALAIESLGGVVAEGVKTTRVIYEMAKKKQLDLPILFEIYAMLYQNKSPKEAISSLMDRPLRAEF